MPLHQWDETCLRKTGTNRPVVKYLNLGLCFLSPVITCVQLKVALSPCIEGLILLDRLCYLKEQVKKTFLYSNHEEPQISGCRKTKYVLKADMFLTENYLIASDSVPKTEPVSVLTWNQCCHDSSWFKAAALWNTLFQLDSSIEFAAAPWLGLETCFWDDEREDEGIFSWPLEVIEGVG